MRFLCLAYEEEEIFARMPQAEWAVLRQETLDYVESLRDSGRLVDAQPLQSATTAVTLRVRAGDLSVTDGPFAETKEQIGGYFLIETDSFEEAVRIASRWPSARLGTIEVRPLEPGLPADTRYATSRASAAPAPQP
jgi:hypothetical protein